MGIFCLPKKSEEDVVDLVETAISNLQVFLEHEYERYPHLILIAEGLCSRASNQLLKETLPNFEAKSLHDWLKTPEDIETLRYFFPEEEISKLVNDYENDIEYDLHISIKRLPKEN